MSLRPRQDFAGRVSIVQSRMAPGGRRWSESPIPRPARRRVRQVGQAVEDLLWGRVLLQIYGSATAPAGYAAIGFARYFAEGTAPYGLEGLTVRLNLTLPSAPPDDDDVSLALVSDATHSPVLSWTIPGPHTGGSVFTTTYFNPVQSIGDTYYLGALFPWPSQDERRSAWYAAWNADGQPQGELVYPP